MRDQNYFSVNILINVTIKYLRYKTTMRIIIRSSVLGTSLFVQSSERNKLEITAVRLFFFQNESIRIFSPSHLDFAPLDLSLFFLLFHKQIDKSRTQTFLSIRYSSATGSSYSGLAELAGIFLSSMVIINAPSGRLSDYADLPE